MTARACVRVRVACAVHASRRGEGLLARSHDARRADPAHAHRRLPLARRGVSLARRRSAAARARLHRSVLQAPDYSHAARHADAAQRAGRLLLGRCCRLGAAARRVGARPLRRRRRRRRGGDGAAGRAAGRRRRRRADAADAAAAANRQRLLSSAGGRRGDGSSAAAGAVDGALVRRDGHAAAAGSGAHARGPRVPCRPRHGDHRLRVQGRGAAVCLWDLRRRRPDAVELQPHLELAAARDHLEARVQGAQDQLPAAAPRGARGRGPDARGAERARAAAAARAADCGAQCQLRRALAAADGDRSRAGGRRRVDAERERPVLHDEALAEDPQPAGQGQPEAHQAAQQHGAVPAPVQAAPRGRGGPAARRDQRLQADGALLCGGAEARVVVTRARAVLAWGASVAFVTKNKAE